MSPDWTEMRQLGSQGFLSETPGPSSSWLESYIPEAARGEVLQAIQEAVRNKEVFTLEHQVWTAEGKVGWVLSRAVPVLDASGAILEWFGAASDVTARRQAVQSLRSAVAERETLLKELHHRVKNNLAVIDSMLQLQADAFPDHRVRAVLEEASNRIHAIAEVHRVLYLSGDFASIDISTYVEALALSLAQALSIEPDRVTVVVEAQSLRMGLAGAVPIGLILNELMTNAMKHAFPGGRRGTIRVEVGRRGGVITLRVQDDGVGLPEPVSETSLGMQLVRILGAQLQGSAEFQSSGGTTVTVRFPAQSLGLAGEESAGARGPRAAEEAS
jgi:two-component sensor histidine kinase